MKAFNVNVNGKLLDYRKPQSIDLEKVIEYFSKKYQVSKVYSGSRHITADISKDKTPLFLKLSTSPGMSAVSQVEYKFNEVFNSQIKRDKSHYWVPINYDCGFFDNSLFYQITEKINGKLLSAPAKQKNQKALTVNIDKLIEFSEIIQNLHFDKPINKYFDRQNYQEGFILKLKSHLESIPKSINKTYNLENVLNFVLQNAKKLNKKPRHGDFTPWHIFQTEDNKLVLIDAEHAMTNSVENYDMAYLVQRVFSVLKEEEIAGSIIRKATVKGANAFKLKVILAARAVGGFLDESMSNKPNYTQAERFKAWVLSL